MGIPVMYTPDRGVGSRLDGGVQAADRGFVSLRLVDLSWIPGGTLFRELHPTSEMASQNDQNKAKL